MMVTSGPTMARMRLAVSMPSISGIFQSTRIMSKYRPLSFKPATKSTALRPLSTHSAWTPISRRVDTALSQTATSSSTTRVFKWEKL